MSNIHVPHLQTGTFSLVDGMMAVFGTDRHRTFFAVQDDEQFNGLMWIGADPSTNLDEWLSFGGTVNVDTFILERGVYGPIYITQDGPQGGQVSFLSSLDEDFVIEPIPT